MNTVNQYKALLPPDEFLAPGSTLIDGRTEQDRLSFLCDYASLINFYDASNTIKGNWAPFLLKDPVFLLASISKTRFSGYHSRFKYACNELSRMLAIKDDQSKVDLSKDDQLKDIAGMFNTLFDLFTDIFIKLKEWIYFMQLADDEYTLRTYIIHQVKTNYSKYFWAIISLRQNMYMTPSFISVFIPWIEPFDHSRFYFYDAYEEKIWKQNKDQTPYLDVLSLQHPLKQNSPQDIFNSLKKVGDDLLGFFNTVITHADSEFENVKAIKSSYPDTTLLRVFTELLKIHQDEQNNLAKKHLEFYYKGILKQTGKPAEPDSVYICAGLAKTDSTFTLPAATQFNAGIDAQKNTILFSNADAVNLNPGLISSGYTLSAMAVPGRSGASAFYLQNIPPPGAVQTDKNGKVQSWPTFGGAVTQQSVVVKPAFALASPMLLLREGRRQISLQLNFKDPVTVQLLADVNYYLSTQSTWIKVNGSIAAAAAGAPANQLTVLVNLDATVPPIEPFAAETDGLNSMWPMLKIEFNSLSNAAAPPILNSVTVTVSVTDVKTFQLFNDYGPLSTKKAYPLFGPTPLLNSDFIIGSTELFSKPVTSLIITLNWDNLPPDFQVYYQQYNNYFYPPAQPSKWAIIRWIKKLFHRNPPPPSSEPFNNTCFKVSFALLDDGSWTDLSIIKLEPNTDSATVAAEPYVVYPADPNVTGPGIQLFNEVNDKLTAVSIFGYQPGSLAGLPPASTPLSVGDPAIQQQLLKYTDTSKWGFIRLRLSAPEYGFGSVVYPNVVASIAMQNAIKIADKDDPSTFLPPANMPFAPALNMFTASYTATCQYSFDQAANNTYPVQCFLYSPFKNYTVYDSANPVATYNYVPGLKATTSTTSGIPFWSPVNYDGCLFLELTNLLPANSFNLYFELARTYGNPYTNSPADYFYMSRTGWQPMSFLSDSTNNFCCSGVIKVNVPDDVMAASHAMPGNNYWMCVAVKSAAAAFAQTVFLQTNGFAVTRMGNFNTADTTAPQLAAAAITKTQSAVPQMATVVQPFPSFGGKAAESHTGMTRRVSARLKTKDRAVSIEDYSRLIGQEYDDIYYAKPVFDQRSKTTGIYVVKAYDNWTDANAFLPMISECREEKMSAYLNERTSVFTNIRVSNFDFQYVKIVAAVSVDPAFAGGAIQKTISQALDIFLSPWISSTAQQVVIDQEISNTDMHNFLKTIPGVLDVTGVNFITWSAAMSETVAPDAVSPITASSLLVSGMDHIIQCNVLK